VTMLRVVTHSWPLCGRVEVTATHDAERPIVRSHAERGNEDTGRLQTCPTGRIDLHLVVLVRLYRRARNLRSIGITAVLMLLTVSILGNAITYLYFDGPVKAEAGTTLTVGDALWYSVISITTIGYGDNYAESTGARLGTFVFVVVVGLAAFSVIVGMAIEGVTEFAVKAHRGMGEVIAQDHTLIVNYPSTAQVRQLIAELKADPHYDEGEIVIVADSLEALPFQEDNVLFVRGPILEEETYKRAKADKARLAIVLATSYADPNSDAVVASAVAVIERINPDLHTVAECINDSHRMLFASVHCDAIVCSSKISGNLLSQEAHDPGISRLIDTMTSNRPQ